MAIRRRSPRRMAYRLALAVGLLALAGGMLRAVERGAEARALSGRLTSIDRQTVEERARLADAMRRLDSLSSRDRILIAAGRLGLHPASDADITFLRLGPAGAEDGTAPRGAAGRSGATR